MKKLITIIGVMLLAISSYAQAPEKFSYQAVVRDAADNLVINGTTPIQISILKTTITGTSVYVETHVPTTNVNGLLSVEIGTGTVLSGTFETIDWGGDKYFIKTEVDVDNNASYDVTGASQLLSVPYALHSKTADSLVGLSSSDLNYLLGLIPPLPQIGDYIHGGVVFWIDPADPYHGLVCAISDQANAIEWGCHGTSLVGASGSQIGDGATNTPNIIAGCATPGIAAATVHNTLINGYSDWFLPSTLTLSTMYTNRAVINATALANGGTVFTTDIYWTSTQNSANTAGIVNFSNGVLGSFNKYFNLNIMNVRAVRAF